MHLQVRRWVVALRHDGSAWCGAGCGDLVFAVGALGTALFAVCGVLLCLHARVQPEPLNSFVSAYTSEEERRVLSGVLVQSAAIVVERGVVVRGP